MVASYNTMEEVYKIIRKHVSDEVMRRIINDLLQVRGNKSFRDTIMRLSNIDEKGEGK